MFNNSPAPKILPFVKKCGEISHRHAHCMLDNYGYRHTLRICNTYCFSSQTTVAGTRPIVTLYAHCVPCHLYDLEVFIKQYLAALHTRKEPNWRRQFALWTVAALRATYTVGFGCHQWHMTASGCTAEALRAGFCAAALNRAALKNEFYVFAIYLTTVRNSD